MHFQASPATVTEMIVDVSYAAPQVQEIINVTLH
jgi:hypothetical protein